MMTSGPALSASAAPVTVEVRRGSELEIPEPGQKESDKAKHRRKLRSAWISFAGRILAHVVGAAASVTLGIVVLHKYQEHPRASVTEVRAPAVMRVSGSRADGAIALAVLPLESFSAPSREDYVADGLTESLIADLARIDGLRVISRTSMMGYKHTQKSLPQIAAELDVDLVIEGSIVKAGDRVRVIAQLIDARTDEHVWAGNYEQPFRDLITLQSEVGSAIVRDVTGALRRSRPAF